jgi:hypothetical protein
VSERVKNAAKYQLRYMNERFPSSCFRNARFISLEKTEVPLMLHNFEWDCNKCMT